MFSFLLCSLVISAVLGQTHPPHTTEDGIACQECPENLAGHYPDMVNAVVDRFIAGEQGAFHMCQSMGACRPVPKIFTCDECIEGMEWIEAYMEDPIFQAEAALFLEQHWCTPERPQCIPAIQHHFIP